MATTTIIKTTFDTSSEPKRASLKQLLKFANQVREAGGGNPLDALMPAIPKDPHQCLIARNLNFNCDVGYFDLAKPGEQSNRVWGMSTTRGVRDKIAKALGLKKANIPASTAFNDKGKPKMQYVVILPPEIGAVARDFDRFADAISVNAKGKHVVFKRTAKEEVDRLKTFWPYVEESHKEAYKNATFVNDKGKIVL